MSSVADPPRGLAPPAPPARQAVGRGKAAWALLVALVALAGSATSLVFTLLPQLKPDPRDSVLAQLSVYAVEPNVSLGNYVTEAYGSIAAAPKALHVPPSERGLAGDVVYVRTRVDGFKHRHVRLVANLYDAKTQVQVNRNALLGPASARTIGLDTPSTSTVQLLWIYSLQGEPPAFVRVEMFDATRMLAVTDSPIIRHNLTPLPAS
jgi:hypothetical protein